MKREHNWARTCTFTPTRIHRPDSIDEVRRIVAGAARIRALGARHSFNAIADSPGDLVDLAGLPAEFVIDRDRRTGTVSAAARYGPLAAYLQAERLALHNTASLLHISVGGAIATGTHGSGDRTGNLSTSVVGLELVTCDGELVD